MKKEAKWFIDWVKRFYPEYFQSFCEHGHAEFNTFLDEFSPESYVSAAFRWDADIGGSVSEYWGGVNKKWRNYLEQKREEEKQRIIDDLDKGVSELAGMFCPELLNDDRVEIGLPISGKTVARIIISLKKDDK